MKKISIQINLGQQKKLATDRDELLTQYQEIHDNWQSLTKEQKQKLLDNSPILASLVTFFGGMQ